MNDKPSYLGLLNAISIGEAEAETYLNCWAATTTHPGVRETLTTIALREGEHAKAFAKRMCELGFSVQPRIDAGAGKRMAIASDPSLTDLQKFDQLGLAKEPDGDDIFATMFKDKSIDIQTGQLLGRYIAEERDSGRMFRACYAQLRSETATEPTPTAASVPPAIEARLLRIESMLSDICSKLAS